MNISPKSGINVSLLCVSSYPTLTSLKVVELGSQDLLTENNPQDIRSFIALCQCAHFDMLWFCGKVAVTAPYIDIENRPKLLKEWPEWLRYIQS